MKKTLTLMTLGLAAFFTAASFVPGGVSNRLSAASNDITPISDAPVSGQSYKLLLDRSDKNKGFYYFTGEPDGHYCATNKDYKKGADVVFTAKDNNTKCTLSFEEKDGSIKYLAIVESSDKQHINAVIQDSEFVLYYDSANKLPYYSFKQDKSDKFVFGTRGDRSYTTIGANDIAKFSNTVAVKFAKLSPQKEVESFAQYLLDVTKNDCAASNVKDATWKRLKNKFNTIAPEAQEIFRNANANEKGSALEHGAARYDVIINAYANHDNFAKRNSTSLTRNITLNESDNTIIITSCCVVGVALILSAAFIIKRKNKAKAE